MSSRAMHTGKNCFFLNDFFSVKFLSLSSLSLSCILHYLIFINISSLKNQLSDKEKLGGKLSDEEKEKVTRESNNRTIFSLIYDLFFFGNFQG